MPNQRKALGDWGEAVALKYLLEKGDRLLARNIRTKYGELDLITRRRGIIVFTEVKTRRSDAFGSPEESITPRKQKHLIDSAHAYLEGHPDHKGDWQIDVIAVRRSGDRPPHITHLENAVSG
jgi:putative endonuclease